MTSSQTSNSQPALISGAGPSGLMLALWLAKYSVPFRIVDKALAPFETSRAIIMHARTLELYRMLGLAEDVLEAGTRVQRFVISSSGKRTGEYNLSDAGKGQSHYPFILSITQDEHEHTLIEKLEKNGVHVERGVEVVGMELPPEDDAEPNVKVTLRVVGDDVDEVMDASYVIGCDGAHSGVRHAAGTAMEGGTYSRSFFVADVVYHGDMQTQGEVNACLAQDEFLVILPLPHIANRARVIGFVPFEYEDLRSVSFEDSRPSVSKCAPSITIDEVRWYATYKVHHRCATSFQHGHRVFLCGDSAHLHSPVGGQGMNTGLGDVSNLAWKLATAWHAENGTLKPTLDLNDAQSLLSSYAAERKPFADDLVRSTDWMFQLMIAQNILGWLLRNIFLPYVFPFLINRLPVGGLIFPRLSQIGIEYRKSPLSNGSKGKTPLAGDRLPWIERPGGAAGEMDNHSLLDGSGWQVHVFGTGRTVPDHIEQLLQRRMIPVHAFPMTAEAKRKGFVNHALYLIRPDGHIGLVLRDDVDAEEELEAYVARWGISQLESKQ